MSVSITFLRYTLYFLFLGHDTAPGEKKENYRPYFLDHFDKKEKEQLQHRNDCLNNVSTAVPHTGTPHPNHFQQNAQQTNSQTKLPQTPERRFSNHLQRQLNQISNVGSPSALHEPAKFQRSFTEGDFSFVSICFHYFLST